ncbi:CHAT domain-containing protein [Aeromicrobium flavum]|uniref:CHAT domain-containing protein n=1 Tax=Aeromicrobium flavum TaxID=416568 RepID=A0A512HRL6_9ACTN|nr:CHAT domain-containing protein [Aeromicrobium flavum]GEO88095.1 CHAT domain-containing protein [Aeromicrobium flavum]
MPPTAAPTLHEHGVAAINRGHFRQARRLLGSALERADEPDLVARISASLAYAEAELGDRAQAMQRCAAALRLPGTSPRARAIVRSQLAVLLSRGGDLDEVIGLYNLAIPALDPGTTERGNVLLNRGFAQLEQNHLTRAETDFDAAARDFRAAGDDAGAAAADHNRGYVAMALGDLVTALRLMDRAERESPDAGIQVRTIGMQDRAEVLLKAGMVTEGTRLLERAVANFSTLRLPRMQAECEFVLGRAVLLTDPNRSRVLARSAARRLRRNGNSGWALRADTLEAIARAIGGGGTPAWLGRAEELAAALRGSSMVHEAQLLDLYAARVAVRLGRLEDARVRLQRARTNPRDSLTERLLERRTKAELSLATGRRRQALRHLQAGLGLLHDWQSSFGSLDLMTSLVGHGRDLAARGIQIALEDGSPELVFEWSERARALTTRVVPVRPPEDPAAAADLVEIRRLTVTEPEAGSPEARRLAELRDRVRRRAWLGTGSGEVRRVAELHEVGAALGSDTALVSYGWDRRSRLHALVVTEDGPTVVDLGDSSPTVALMAGLRADLDVSAGELGEAIGRVVLAGRRRRLAEVATALVAPVLPLVGDRRVVLTHSGILAGVPWSMLPGFVGRPVTVASAATRWLATRGLPTPTTGTFVAGPDVDRAVEEVKQSSARWPGSTCLTDGQATVAATLAAADGASLLHISAHGRHAAENPLFSAVLLADGPLFGYDLDQLKNVPDVVILSACEVGRSTQRWAEESLGMVNAWLHAGARCVIASPAAVADDEACEVLQDVHRLMAAGTPPGVALAEATADRPTSFVCFGAGW